jgi:hypothetical protein
MLKSVCTQLNLFFCFGRCRGGGPLSDSVLLSGSEREHRCAASAVSGGVVLPASWSRDTDAMPRGVRDRQALRSMKHVAIFVDYCFSSYRLFWISVCDLSAEPTAPSWPSLPRWHARSAPTACRWAPIPPPCVKPVQPVRTAAAPCPSLWPARRVVSPSHPAPPVRRVRQAPFLRRRAPPATHVNRAGCIPWACCPCGSQWPLLNPAVQTQQQQQQQQQQQRQHPWC